MMMKHCLFVSASCLLFAISARPSTASPLTISGSFAFLDNRSANDAGVGSGVFDQFGENSVIPNGQNGTTATANLFGSGTISLPNLNEGVNANLFSRTVFDSTANRGSWTLNFQNGA